MRLRSAAALAVLVLVLAGPVRGAFPQTFTDALGRSVTLLAAPRRIISLAPSVTEILFAVGLDSRIVGISTADDYPPDKVRSKPRVGGVQLDVERIVGLRPDLILGIPSLQAAQLRRLIQMGLPVVAVDANSIAETYAQIEMIGRITGRSDSAHGVVRMMQQREAGVSAAVRNRQSPRVYIEIWGEPLIAAGGHTFIDDVVRRGGGTNIFADLRGWPQVSEEAVIRRGPEVILLTYPGREQVISRRGWQNVPAVRSSRIAVVSPALVSRPGPRIVDGLIQVAHLLHPGAFR